MIDWHGVVLADEIAEQLAAVEQAMRDAVRDRTAPDVRVLLWGEPGTGKTRILRELATHAGVTPIAVPQEDLHRVQYIGQSSSLVRQIFARARTSAPSALIIDAFEHSFGSRAESSDSFMSERIMEFLTDLDMCRPDCRVYITGEAHDLGRVDPAVLSRMYQQLEIPLPDYACRVEILRRALAARRCSRIGADVIEELAERLSGHAGRALEYIVRKAAEDAVGVAFESGGTTDDAVVTPELLFQNDVVRAAGGGSQLPSTASSRGREVPQERAGLDSLEWADEFLGPARRMANVLRRREEFEPRGVHVPVAILIAGPAEGAARLARAFACDAGLPIRELHGDETLKWERAHPGFLRSQLEAATASAPCAVLITDVERIVAKRGSPNFDEEPMRRAWTDLMLRINHPKSGPPYVLLIFTSAKFEDVDDSIRLRAGVRFEVPESAAASDTASLLG